MGYVLELVLKYPSEFYHNDLPFYPKNFILPYLKLSKLIPNLQDKERYIIHYRYSKQRLVHTIAYIVHRILYENEEFTTIFEREFLKLMGNL